jgi:hypothetical protein
MTMRVRKNGSGKMLQPIYLISATCDPYRIQRIAHKPGARARANKTPRLCDGLVDGKRSRG